MERKKADKNDDEDAEFVAALTAGQAAIAVVVRALMPGESGFEEVVQQTNARLWEKRAEFEIGTHFQAWASAIARYEVLNYRKQQARDSRLRFSDELEQTIADEAPQFLNDLPQQQIALRMCLAEMNVENRELLLARYRGDESISQLASRVGRSAGGIRVTLSRLRDSLQKCIERKLETGEGLA